MAYPDETSYLFDLFCLDVRRGTLTGPGNAEIELRPKAFFLLRHFLNNPGRLLSREALLDAVWPGVAVTDDSLTQCISDLRRGFRDRASHVLRTLPRRGYMLVAEVDIAQPAQKEASIPPSRIGDRSVALTVRSFELRVGAAATEEFTDALSADLVSELSRIEGLRVAPVSDADRREGFRVSGEVRLQGPHLRIALRIEDATDGVLLWVERLERLWSGAAHHLEELVNLLAACVERQVNRESIRRATGAPLSELTARELCLLGREQHHASTEAGTLMARDLFDRAMASDPGYAPAYAWQAKTVDRAVTLGWGSPGGQEGLDLCLTLARSAVQLEPESSLCLTRLAYALMLHRRWDEALQLARTGLRVGRKADYPTIGTGAEVLAYSGYPEEAVTVLERAIELNPFCPASTRSVLGQALMLAGRPEDALAELRLGLARMPDSAPTYWAVVVAGSETGRLAEAKSAFREICRLQPDKIGRILCSDAAITVRRASDLARYVAALEAASSDTRLREVVDNAHIQAPARRRRRNLDANSADLESV